MDGSGTLECRAGEAGTAALTEYLRSVASVAPPLHDVSKVEASEQFTSRLQHEYSATRRAEVQRSSRAEHEGPEGAARAAVELHSSPGFGRYLVAARDIRAGDLLFQEKPLVMAPKAGAVTCLACLRPLGSNHGGEGADEVHRGCEGCGAPLCWPRCLGSLHHKDECDIVSRLGLDNDSGNSILLRQLSVLLTPLRTLLTLQTRPELRPVVAALQSHVRERMNLPVGRWVEGHVVALFQRLCVAMDADVIHHICGVFDTNAFDVTTEEGGRGRALLPLASLMNHTCRPNTQHWYHEGVMKVVAVTDIPEGAPVTNTYTNTLWGTGARAAHLHASKLFRCGCDRCLDPTEFGTNLSSVRCRECRQGLLTPQSTPSESWVCATCGAHVSRQAVDAAVRAGGAALAHVHHQDAHGAAAAVNHMSRVLGDNHYIVAQLKYSVVQATMTIPPADVSLADLAMVVHMTTDLLALVDVIEPGYTRFRGLLLLERARAMVEMLRRQNVKENESDRVDGETKSNCISAEELRQDLEECSIILRFDLRHPEINETIRQFHGLQKT